jgi:homoserine/homoserine lactone efflux protein
MELGQIISFLLVSAIVIGVPGPNVVLIVATTLASGKRRGLQTIVGTTLAMIIQLATAALGTAMFLAALSQGLIWLKWCGVVYLFFLGFNSLYAFYTHKKSERISATATMQRGFWVALTNPKTILFFSAFLPQFASPHSSYLPQIAILSGCFLLLAVTMDSCYVILSARLKWLLASKDIDRISNGVSGALFIGAGGLLAATNRI